MKRLMEDKRGATFTGWTEIILFTVLFMGGISIFSGGLNDSYGTNNDLTYGLQTNNTLNEFVNKQDTYKTALDEGEAQSGVVSGLSWSSSWQIITSTTTTIWKFISGQFIGTLVSLMGLPSIVATILQILFFLSIGYIILKMLFKVVP